MDIERQSEIRINEGAKGNRYRVIRNRHPLPFLPSWEIVSTAVKYSRDRVLNIVFSPRDWNGVTLDGARQTRRIAVPPFHKLDLAHVGQFRLRARGRL